MFSNSPESNPNLIRYTQPSDFPDTPGNETVCKHADINVPEMFCSQIKSSACNKARRKIII